MPSLFLFLKTRVSLDELGSRLRRIPHRGAKLNLKGRKGKERKYPLPRTESLAMSEAVPASGRVRNFKVCGHVNMVSQVPKKGNVLFNDALNTFYLRLYGVGHIVNDHSYS